MKRVRLFLVLLSLLLCLSSCAPKEPSSEGQTADYESTKKMMMDLLQTEDGKKAIQKVIKQDKTKELYMMDQPFIKETIEQTLTSDKAKEFWNKTMSDPKMAAAFAQSMAQEQKRIMKELMKDPEYQAMLIEVMQNPELEKSTLQLLKSQKYRDQVQQVVSETLNSPMYQGKIMEMMQKANEEKQDEKSKEKK